MSPTRRLLSPTISHSNDSRREERTLPSRLLESSLRKKEKAEGVNFGVPRWIFFFLKAGANGILLVGFKISGIRITSLNQSLKPMPEEEA